MQQTPGGWKDKSTFQRPKNSPDHIGNQSSPASSTRTLQFASPQTFQVKGQKLPSLLGCRAPAISSILPQHLSAGCHTHITMGHSVPRRVPTLAHLPLQYIQLYPARARGQRPCSRPVQAEGRGRAVGDAAPAPTCQAGRTFSMSFRLIPSPSSSFPFPHLGQKRHNGFERTAHSSIVSQPSK